MPERTPRGGAVGKHTHLDPEHPTPIALKDVGDMCPVCLGAVATWRTEELAVNDPLSSVVMAELARRLLNAMEVGHILWKTLHGVGIVAMDEPGDEEVH